MDKSLPEKLKFPREQEVILSWLVSGAIRYYKEGLSESHAVFHATSEYLKTCDSVGRFVSECLVPSKTTKFYASDLYNSYKHFCDENDLEPLTLTSFGRNMLNQNVLRDRDSKGKYYKCKLKIGNEGNYEEKSLEI